MAHGNASSLPPTGAIKHVIVIDLENEDESTTFGPTSPATYLNDTLLPAGELITNYYAVGHVSLDNYIAQVSGQAPNLLTSSDCVSSITSLPGPYTDVTPGTLDPNQAAYPGQVDGQGCVCPHRCRPSATSSTRPTRRPLGSDWREYAEDMGNDPGPRRRRRRPARRHRLRPPGPGERAMRPTTPTTPKARTPPAPRSSPR